MLQFERSRLVFRFSIPPSFFIWGSFQVRQLQLVSPSPKCFITFVVLRKNLSISLFFHFPLIFILWSARGGKIHSSVGSLFSFFVVVVTMTRSCSLAGFRGFVSISKTHKILSVLSFYYLRVFHISVSWRFSTSVRVTASLFKSPGLF